MKPEKYKRPRTLQGKCIRGETGCGHIYVTLNHTDEGKLVEIFATVGKSGQCAKAQMEALTRSITLGLKYDLPIEEYIRQLKGIRCLSPIKDAESCADAIAKIIEEERTNRQEV